MIKKRNYFFALLLDAAFAVAAIFACYWCLYYVARNPAQVYLAIIMQVLLILLVLTVSLFVIKWTTASDSGKKRWAVMVLNAHLLWQIILLLQFPLDLFRLSLIVLYAAGIVFYLLHKNVLPPSILLLILLAVLCVNDIGTLLVVAATKVFQSEGFMALSLLVSFARILFDGAAIVMLALALGSSVKGKIKKAK